MWARILSLLLGRAGVLLQLVLTRLVERNTFNEVLELAERTVAQYVGRSDLTGDAKRAAVAAEVKADLRAIGKEVLDSLVNLAIELALAGLRAKGVVP